MVYPLFETALRAAARPHASTSTSEHVSELWARFAAVAAEQPERVVATGVHARGDPHGLARQPHGVLPVPEAHVRQHRRRPGRRAAAVLVRGGARGRRARRPHGVPARGGRGARPLLLHRAVVARRLARRSRPRSATRSRRRASRVDDIAHFDLYSCFPSAVQIGGARARHRRRRPAPAHRHRRARLRGRAGQQLPDARDRAHGRGAARAIPTTLRPARPRSAGTSRSTRPACGRRRRPRRLPARRPRDEPGEGRRAPEPRAGRARRRRRRRSKRRRSRSSATARPSLGIVTALTDDGRRALANARDADVLAAITTEAREGRTVKITNDGTTNTARSMTADGMLR